MAGISPYKLNVTVKHQKGPSPVERGDWLEEDKSLQYLLLSP